MFVLLCIAFHKWEFWWYSKKELVIYWETCIWRQNRGSVPEGYALTLPGFVRCPKEAECCGAAKLLWEKSGWVALGWFWEMWIVSELVRRKKMSPRGLSVVWLLGKKQRGRAEGDEGTPVRYLCLVQRQNVACCLQYMLTVVALSSTFAEFRCQVLFYNDSTDCFRMP